MARPTTYPEPDRPRTVPHPRRLPTPPLWITDGEGRIIGIHEHGAGPRADEVDALVDLYARFGPDDRAQGLPPRGADAITAWLDSVQAGVHLLAWDGTTAAGHAMLVPDTGGLYELAIFVGPDYQAAGIGSMLLPALLGHGRRQDVEAVWLTVEPWNRPAVRLYLDYGFAVVDSSEGELRMRFELTDGRPRPDVPCRSGPES